MDGDGDSRWVGERFASVSIVEDEPSFAELEVSFAEFPSLVVEELSSSCCTN